MTDSRRNPRKDTKGKAPSAQRTPKGDSRKGAKAAFPGRADRARSSAKKGGMKGSSKRPSSRTKHRAPKIVERAAAFASRGRTSSSLCPVERQCGACQMLSVPYEEQLADKQERMESLFAGLLRPDAEVREILGMDDPFHYRNKVMSPYAPGRKVASKVPAVAKAKGGAPKGAGSRPDGRKASARREILCGMYAQGTHRIIATDSCLIENEVAKRIVLTIRDLMPRFRVEPYDEDAQTGFLRHAVVRVGHESGEVLVTLVTNGRLFPGGKNFVRELVRRCPEITTVVQNVNTRNTNVVLGDEAEHTLYGPGFILDRLCGLSFRISSRSFYQVNATQTEVLYRAAIELANLTGAETVLDAYCGTGTIGLVAARGLPERGAGSDASRAPGAARVIGVDSVASAIADAKSNAAHNRVDNAEFFAKDAGAFMRELALRDERVDVLLMDPPRAGASEEFLRAVADLRPRRIVYVSCNPKTQVRDAAWLVEHGFALVAMQPVDMFPHTEHVENVCAFEPVDERGMAAVRRR